MTEQEKQSIVDMYEKSESNRETEVTLLGNRNTIIGVITLLSYIRNCIINHEQKDITVSIGKNVDNADFEFTVNDEITDNLIAKDKIEIN